MTKEQAIAFRKKIEAAASLLNDETALESIDLFPSWKVDITVSVGERYKYNGKLYKVVQAHVTQSDWTPDVAKSLFTEVSIEEWPEWVQPTGVQDAYMAGDKVTFEGEHYISTMDNNVWSPTAYPAAWNKQ